MTQVRSFLTTPLYYVNARPHLGHSYTTILADVISKHRRQRGQQCVFLTGTDEHGEKIEQIAKKEGREPQALADEVAADFKDTWKKMGLDFDIFYRTTDPDHIKKVKYALQSLKDKGEIVFREYEGLYCIGCERFLTESELNPKRECPDHLTQPVPRKESNYFFLMSKYQSALKAHLEKFPNTIQPEHYRNEIISFLKNPLEDLCISRPKSRLTWGIELPFDDQYVTYVWFDALLNYINACGWPDQFDRPLWESCTHLTAKDIIKAHGVYWTTMLMALGVPLYKSLQVSGYWLIDGTKMSKSLGNAIRPLELEAQYGQDTLRFYLLREMSYGLDSTFTLQTYINCINAYLANGIGNLASRVITIAQKSFRNIQINESDLTSRDQDLLSLRGKTLDLWNVSFEDLKYQNALKGWTDLVTQVDLYVNEMKPWALAKDPAQKDRLQVVMGVCLRMLEALGCMIFPVLPHAADTLLRSIGVQLNSSKSTDCITGSRVNYAISDVPKLFMRVAMQPQEI